MAKDGRGGLHRISFRPGTCGPATRRLRLLLCASLLCVALPLTLLLSRVYQYLAQEMFYQYRSAAEEVVKQVNQRLADILQGEELRPFDEYSFLKVTANPLFKNSAIIASPLSELPPQSVRLTTLLSGRTAKKAGDKS